MNLLRVALAGLLVLGLSVSARADEKKADKKQDDNARKAVGLWEVTEGESLDPGSTLELAKDGKLKLVAKRGEQSVTLEGTYKVTGKDFYMKVKLPNGDEHEETMKITKLTDKELVTFDDNKKTDTFKRKK
jgi:uncharacterized protein (TIGR03066 family)